jgi:hypothetical protein
MHRDRRGYMRAYHLRMGHTTGTMGKRLAEDERPPSHVWSERDRAIAASIRMSLTAKIMGDPLPGRSALERDEG